MTKEESKENRRIRISVIGVSQVEENSSSLNLKVDNVRLYSTICLLRLNSFIISSLILRRGCNNTSFFDDVTRKMN